MSELKARVTASDRSFRVEGYERIDYDLVYVDGVFELGNADLADCYRDYGRALMVIDETVYRLYRQQIDGYFSHHGIALTVVSIAVREISVAEVEDPVDIYQVVVDAFIPLDAKGPVRGGDSGLQITHRTDRSVTANEIT